MSWRIVAAGVHEPLSTRTPPCAYKLWTACPESQAPTHTSRPTWATSSVELFDDKAPKTVANFVGLAEGTKEWKHPKTGEKVKTPFYDGLIFHRVIAAS